MNAYEIRKHLAAGHYLEYRGLDYDALVKVHAQEHEAVQGHYHDPDEAPR